LSKPDSSFHLQGNCLWLLLPSRWLPQKTKRPSTNSLFNPLEEASLLTLSLLILFDAIQHSGYDLERLSTAFQVSLEHQSCSSLRWWYLWTRLEVCVIFA
jgi:hypothetical protein